MQELDYNNEEVLKILNDNNYTDEEKKNLFEKYKQDLKEKRKKEIIARLNECAKNIPTITKDIYINFLKKYENDNLSKPFEVIEQEIKDFETEMTSKYNEYLSAKKEEEKEETIEEITPDVKPEVKEEIPDEFDDTMFKDPEEFKPSTSISSSIDDNEVSVLNEEPEILAKPLNSKEEEKEVMPEELSEPLGEKGNASAIILSIIAIIIGAVVMYSIIRLK